jgi:Zn-finger nucleic acid-binding protein
MPLDCPRCARPLEHHQAKGLEAWTCRLCAGALVSNRIEQVLETRGEGLQRPMGAVALEAVDEAPRIACPSCQARMVRHLVRGVTVDTCEAHGTWYDRGELKRMVLGMGAGKLAAGVAAAGVAASLASPPPETSTSSAAQAVAEVGVEVAAEVALEAGGAVLEFLGDLLGGLG